MTFAPTTPTDVNDSVLVKFTWNRLDFCEERRCIVEAWLTEWNSDTPTVFLCLAEQGERIYAERFRSNGELNNVLEADIELPDVSLTLVRKKWMTVCVCH